MTSETRQTLLEFEVNFSAVDDRNWEGDERLAFFVMADERQLALF